MRENLKESEKAGWRRRDENKKSTSERNEVVKKPAAKEAVT